MLLALDVVVIVIGRSGRSWQPCLFLLRRTGERRHRAYGQGYAHVARVIFQQLAGALRVVAVGVFVLPAPGSWRRGWAGRASRDRQNPSPPVIA